MPCLRRSGLALLASGIAALTTVANAAPAAAQLVVPFAVPGNSETTALPDAIVEAAQAFDLRAADAVLLEHDWQFERAMIDRTAGLTGARAQFFDGEYSSAAEALGGWLHAFQADAWVLALHEDFAARALDAMLTLARAHFALNDADATASTIAATLALFPTAIPQAALYPAWVLETWETAGATRDQTVTLASTSACSATLNGLEAPVDTPVPVSDGTLWARWDCGGRSSRLYRVEAGDTLHFDDALDAALLRDGSRVLIASPSADPTVQAALLGSLIDLLDESAMEGWTALENNALQLVLYELRDGAVSVVAARGQAEPDAVRRCARDGRCSSSLERWQPGIGWPEPASAPRVVGIAALVASGLATGTGVVLEVALKSALQRVDSCADSAACVLTPDALDDRRARASTLRTGATAAWIAAGATAITGLVALVPAWGRRELPVAGSVGRDGVRLIVRTRF